MNFIMILLTTMIFSRVNLDFLSGKSMLLSKIKLYYYLVECVSFSSKCKFTVAYKSAIDLLGSINYFPCTWSRRFSFQYML